MDSLLSPFKTCFMFWLARGDVPLYVVVSVSSLCTVAGFDEVILCLDVSAVDMTSDFVRKTYFPEVSEVVSPEQFFDEEAFRVYKSLKGQYSVVNKADFFRIYALCRFGGFYCDVDTLVLKSFRALPVGETYVSSEDGARLSNGIVYARKGHPVFEFMLQHFTQRWQPNTFNLVGSQWYTELKEYFCVDWNKEHHYSIGWQEWKKLFQPFPHDIGELLRKDIFSLHLWGTTLRRNNFYLSPDFVKERPSTLFAKAVLYLAEKGSSICKELC